VRLIRAGSAAAVQMGLHWKEKRREDMTERDWRIFREDYNISYKGAMDKATLPIRNWDEANLPPDLIKVSAVQLPSHARPPARPPCRSHAAELAAAHLRSKWTIFSISGVLEEGKENWQRLVSLHHCRIPVHCWLGVAAGLWAIRNRVAGGCQIELEA